MKGLGIGLVDTLKDLGYFFVPVECQCVVLLLRAVVPLRLQGHHSMRS